MNITDWSLSSDMHTLLLETKSDIGKLIKYLSSRYEVEDIGQITQVIEYEPEWDKLRMLGYIK